MRKDKQKKYEGFSLIEMLLTIFILGVVMLISARTLTTLIKVSLISEAKSITRTEVDFMLEVVSRSLNSANLEDIHIYDSKDVREYDFVNNQIVDSPDTLLVEDAYSNEVEEDGTEIHIRSYGYDRWICIGYFKDTVTDHWHLLKTSVPERDDPEDCFSSGADLSQYTIVLNSLDVHVGEFLVGKNTLNEGNTFFTVDIFAEPVNWPVAEGRDILVNKGISKQITVSTQGLTWYY